MSASGGDAGLIAAGSLFLLVLVFGRMAG